MRFTMRTIGGALFYFDNDRLMTDEDVLRRLNILSETLDYHKKEKRELKEQVKSLKETLAYRSNQLALMERLVDDLGSDEMARQMEEILG